MLGRGIKYYFYLIRLVLGAVLGHRLVAAGELPTVRNAGAVYECHLKCCPFARVASPITALRELLQSGSLFAAKHATICAH